MLACKLGCDDLYELGYLAVNDRGQVLTVQPHEAAQGALVSELIARLSGRTCKAFTAATSAYFEWHRRNKFRGNTDTP